MRIPLLLGATLAACTRVVDVELPDAPPRLVVEARLERIHEQVTGNQALTLSTTLPYLSGRQPLPATGARVTVTDDRARAVTFVEGPAGTYRTDALIVERGRTYRLRIDWQGQRFEASAATATIPRIDALYFAKPAAGITAGVSGVRATIDAVDPPNERNWYLWDQFHDGRRLFGFDSTARWRVIATDEIVAGRPFTGYQPFEGIHVPVGTSVLLRQIGISEELYRFYFSFNDQVNNDGSVFAVPLTSVRGNVANMTDPTRYALGYFSASEVSEARAVRR